MQNQRIAVHLFFGDGQFHPRLDPLPQKRESTFRRGVPVTWRIATEAVAPAKKNAGPKAGVFPGA